MKKFTLSAAVLSLATLAGCASPAVFKDPKTGQLAQCQSATPGVFPLIAQYEINTCANSYQRAGWERM